MIAQTVLLLLMLAQTTPAPADETDDARAAEVTARLRSQFADWCKTNVDMRADPDLVGRLTAQMDQSLAKGDNIIVVFDGGLIRDRTGRYVVTWGGRFHAFKLTMEQCRATGAAPGAAVATIAPSTEASDAWNPAPFHVEGLQIHEPDKIAGDKPITGRIVCRKAGVVPSGRIVLRMNVGVGSYNRFSLQFLDELPADGIVNFSVGPVNTEEGDVNFGPTCILVDVLLTSGMIRRGTVASDAAGAVVNVPPDPEGYMRATLQFMEQIVTILAGVKDETTATQAVKDYKEAAVKSASLVEAMERMGPVPPELDAALSKKYNPQLDAVVARMQAEMTRLEQAPYAGEAFFARIEEKTAQP